MFDYLHFIQKIIEISDGRTGFLVICNKDGRIEYCKSWDSSGEPFIQRHMGNITGRHVLEVYPDLTEETSTVMQVLRTGRPVVNLRQTLTFNNQVALSFTSNTIPFLVDGEIMGAIDYCVSAEPTGSDDGHASANGLYTLKDIVTRDSAMLAIKERIRHVAGSDTPALIYGETGTGKELIAESLHTAGGRAKGPFIAQNCSAIPPNLMEGIFFGTEKGAFTGAESKKGLFELADGGTLFLDEISAMEMPLQAKLLKVVEEKRVRRLGGAKAKHFDVRIVCASNIVPEILVRQKLLREDLYYRIGVIRLDIPPLRQRKGDIPLLTDHFIAAFNRKMRRNVRGLSPLMLRLLMASDWPGNVRELKNVIERDFNLIGDDAVIIDNAAALLGAGGGANASGDDSGVPLPTLLAGLPESELTQDAHVSRPLKEPVSPAALAAKLNGEGVDLRQMLDEYEAYVITQALRQERQLNKVARKLSISPQRLQYRLERLGLRPEKFKNFD